MKKIAQYMGALVTLFFLVACNETQQQGEHKLGFESFAKHYNNNVNQWLTDEIDGTKKLLVTAQENLAKADSEEAKKRYQAQIEEFERTLVKHQRRLDHGEYFSFRTLDDVPQDLVWEDGMDNPEIGDPRATKGGVFREFIPDFPATVRPFGDNSINFFRGYIYDNIAMGLVGVHPITDKFIPALAKQWAIGEDGRTVFYKIDPDARYSNGEKVRAKDFMIGLYVRLSDNVNDPYSKQYYKAQFGNITVYSEDTLSITFSVKRPKLPYYAQVLPAPPEFYKEYGPDYQTRYQWKAEPTTGAYTLLPENIKKGKSLTLTRVKDWWAKDKKFYRNSYNADRLQYLVVRDKNKAFELFRAGELDYFLLTDPSDWYDKMEIAPYFDGYIAKSQFYNIYPRVPRGFYINTNHPKLRDLNVREGIAYAMNFDKVNTILYRGDFERANQFSDGFGKFTNPDIKAREYSIKKARESFSKAGYTRSDSEGYLINDAGERLEIEFSWSSYAPTNKMMALLSEDAKKAGLRMLLNELQSTVHFRQMLEKRHQIGYMGWGVTPPFPRYFQHFHSSNAFDEKGNPKQQTNNMTLLRSDRMDQLTQIVRNASTEEELQKAAWEVQEIVHDKVLYIPALKSPYVRCGYWRWVKWPQTKTEEFSAPTIYIPNEGYQYWIDEEAKVETEQARQDGKLFKEKNYVFDLYRDGIPPLEELEKREPTVTED
jgi:microcin C transport system substrate-binding protein